MRYGTVCFQPSLILYHSDSTDTGFKSSAYLSEALQDPEFSRSGEPNKTALNMAFNTSLTSFEWEALPENSYRRKLLSIGMAGVQNVAASVAVLEGMFVWSHH